MQRAVNQATRTQIQTCSIQARSLAGRWRMRDEVPDAQHTQTMELSPGKSEYLVLALERSARVHGGRADG